MYFNHFTGETTFGRSCATIGSNKDLWYRTCRALASLAGTEKGEFPIMLNIRDLKIDNASLGQKMLLVEVVPAYE